MELPLLVLRGEDKAMPLDLSYSRGSSSCYLGDDSDDDDDDKDDLIVTLALPGRQDAARHCSEPIVIPSDSEDSDADVTIVSDYSTLSTIRANSIGIGKSSSFGEVLGIPITGPADDTDDDCFVSFSSTADNASKTQAPSAARALHAGIKRIFEDSSSQSSIESPPSPLGGSVVQGKDAFLSDASSLSSAEDLGLVLSSTDNKTVLNCTADNPAKAPVSLEFDKKSLSLSHSTTVNVAVVKDMSSAKTQISTDFVDENVLSSKSITVLPASPVKSSFAYVSIAQLLASQQADTSALTVPSQVPAVSTTKTALSRSVADSLFCIPSFDSLYPDSSQVDNSKTLSSSASKLVTSKSSSSSTDIDLVVSPRTCRRRGSVVKSNSTASAVSDVAGDKSPTDKEWTIQSKGECKLLLRRSLSQTAPSSSAPTTDNVASTALMPASKRRRLLSTAVPATVANDILLSDNSDIVVSFETSMCYGCRQQISTRQLSYCMAGHGCCGQCLQSQVKTLLASGKKGTLKCRYTACMSFYLVSQLHNSLPSMVVEILEEKLDREYCDNAAKLMLKAIGKGLIGAFSDDDFDDRDPAHSGKDDAASILELPKNWEPMTTKEDYRLVDLVCGTEEYAWVVAQFHQSMTRPRAQIVKIQRAQNPILWQFYMVKKKQMERDNNRPVVEKNLFHGTARDVIDSICRNNFDWRLCGAHGTMYGQGSYFAVDAAYSHMYTDQPASRSSRQGQSSTTAPPSNTIFNVGPAPPPPIHHQMTGPASTSNSTSAAATQMLFQAFPGSSHAVSIAALHSCRFAHLQGSLLPPPAQATSGGYVPVPLPAYYFGPLASSSPTVVMPAAVSTDASPHVHCMFLARVLVGEYMTGKSSYRKPPAVDTAQPYGRCYDSCVNDLNNPTIFVIFNNSQCYPEYIIEYTNKPRDGAP